MSYLKINNLQKAYTKDKPVLKDISTLVEKGTVTALVGESGCGKTTLLRSIAGFEEPERGEVVLDNKILQDKKTFVAPEKRKIGFLFQDYALFPHLTVEENIAFGLSKVTKKEVEKKTKEVLELLGIEGLGNRYPHEISGGQQQRVALARALAPAPELLLMDEPFSNIDNLIKDQVRTELKSVLQKSGITTIIVTHDMEDAMVMADHIMIMKEGNILQKGSPKELYKQPVDEYVAGFFGQTNWLEVTTTNAISTTCLGTLSATHNSDFVLLRPEEIKVEKEGVEAIVESCEFRGSYYRLKVKAGEKRLILNSEKEHFSGSKIHLKVIHDSFHE